ncbi:PEP-CTERM sorting domain-containing protein, partial [Cephaloticoccus capnophilus]
PPQPEITYKDKLGSTYGAVLNISGEEHINNGFVGGVKFNPSSSGARLYIDSGVATIDAGGIHIYNGKWSEIRGPGQLTSNQKFLDIVAHVDTTGVVPPGKRVHYGLRIESVISGKMGLRMSGKHEGTAIVYLQGNQNNTFTGNVEVSGGSNYLALGKTNGAIAVLGNVFVSSGAVLRFDASQQLRFTSNVTLKNATLYHSVEKKEIRNKFHRLTVSGSRGVVSFGSGGTHSHKRYLYIDELVIEDKARIEVNEWAPGRDFFLVKKTMNKEDLDALMGKIHFRGWLPGRTHLESYDKDYWQISGTPEPSTYGAIFGALGLGLSAWRARRKRRSQVGP